MAPANSISMLRNGDEVSSVSMPFAKSVKMVKASSIPMTMVMMQNLVAFLIGIPPFVRDNLREMKSPYIKIC